MSYILWLEFMTGNSHTYTHPHKYTTFNVLNLTAIPAVETDFVNYILITSLKVSSLKCQNFRDEKDKLSIYQL